MPFTIAGNIDNIIRQWQYIYRERGLDSTGPGALIEQLEGVKRGKYRHLALLPFVVSHLGRFGASAQGVLKVFFRSSDEQQRSFCIADAYQSIARVIQKHNVRLSGTANVLLGA